VNHTWPVRHFSRISLGGQTSVVELQLSDTSNPAADSLITAVYSYTVRKEDRFWRRALFHKTSRTRTWICGSRQWTEISRLRTPLANSGVSHLSSDVSRWADVLQIELSLIAPASIIRAFSLHNKSPTACVPRMRYGTLRQRLGRISQRSDRLDADYNARENVYFHSSV